MYTTSATSVSSPGESDLEDRVRRPRREDKRECVWTLRGLRPGRTTFYLWEWTAGWGRRAEGVEGRSRDGEGVRVPNFYRLTKIYISFVCTLGGKGGMGRGEVEREREIKRERERGKRE